MDERKRILELVKQGVISTDEALSLLENLAKQDDAYREKKEFESEEIDFEARFEKEIERKEREIECKEEEFEQKEAEIERAEEDLERMEAELEKEEADLEERLEEISDEITHYSKLIDQKNVTLQKLRIELNEAEIELANKEQDFEDRFAEEREELDIELSELKHERELASLVTELDQTDEIKRLDDTIAECQKKIDALNEQFQVEAEGAYGNIANRVEILKKEIEAVTEEKYDTLRRMHGLKMKLWSKKAKRVSDKFDIPEDWQSGTEKSFNKASDFFSETADNVSQIIGELVDKGRSVLDNFEWKDFNVNVSVPKIVEAEFNYSWSFEDVTATILDFKNSNGNLLFETTDSDQIEIDAHIKIYGTFGEETAEEALKNRMTVEMTEDYFKFHIPNKRIHASMIIRLPKKKYDYVSVTTLNGNIDFTSLKASDVMIKSTNGQITLYHLDATMLEVKVTNGNITLKYASLVDLIASSVNGNFRGIGQFKSSDISLTNGTIRLTLQGEDLIQLKANSFNGAIKIALPEEVSIDGYAQTSMGRIKSQLTDFNWTDTRKRHSHKAKFERLIDGKSPAKVVAQTTNGKIMLKTTDL